MVNQPSEQHCHLKPHWLKTSSCTYDNILYIWHCKLQILAISQSIFALFALDSYFNFCSNSVVFRSFRCLHNRSDVEGTWLGVDWGTHLPQDPRASNLHKVQKRETQLSWRFFVGLCIQRFLHLTVFEVLIRVCRINHNKSSKFQTTKICILIMHLWNHFESSAPVGTSLKITHSGSPY